MHVLLLDAVWTLEEDGHSMKKTFIKKFGTSKHIVSKKQKLNYILMIFSKNQNNISQGYKRPSL